MMQYDLFDQLNIPASMIRYWMRKGPAVLDQTQSELIGEISSLKKSWKAFVKNRSGH
jgi:hypothetical protein